jgi:hypothetical protein
VVYLFSVAGLRGLELANASLRRKHVGSDEEHVSQCGEAIDNDVPVVLGRNILCLTRPKFGRPIDVGGTHAVRTRMPMIIVMSSNEHDLVRRQSRDRFPDLASCARSSNGTGITPLDLLQPGCRRLCCRRSAGGLALRTHAPLLLDQFVGAWQYLANPHAKDLRFRVRKFGALVIPGFRQGGQSC